MTLLPLTDGEFYQNGIATQTGLVGYEAQSPWVARYAFTAPKVGATSQLFTLEGIVREDGGQLPLRYRITTDPDSYATADANSPFHGTVALSDGVATCQGALRLTPGATYYLWVFPGENRWGRYRFPGAGTVTCQGISQGFPSVTAAECLLGQRLEISILSDPAYTHRLTWQFGEKTGVIGVNLGQSTQWIPTLSMARDIPNSPTGLCLITCHTFENGRPIGAPATTSVQLRVPQSLAPQVTATYSDTSVAGDVFPFFVEKISQLLVDPVAAGAYGADIVSTAVLLDGKAYAGSVLPAGAHILAVTATDTRGLTGTVTYPITVEPYKAPQLTLRASRCTADGTPDDNGAYAYVTFTGAVSPLAGNLRELTFTYGNTTLEIPLEADTFTAHTCIPAPSEKTLTLSAKLRDSLRSTVRSMTLSTGYATVDFLKGGKGIAFGAVATREGFHCGMDARFTGKITDGQGRALVGLAPLIPAEGVGLTVTYGRVLQLLDTQTLQLRFSLAGELPKGTVLFDGLAGLSGTQTVWDSAGAFKLKASTTKVQTDSVFPPGIYTFHCALY